MSDVLLVPRRGAGVPMRILVVRRPGPRVRFVVRRLLGQGVGPATVAARLGLRTTFVRRLQDGDQALGWGPALRAVERELAA